LSITGRIHSFESFGTVDGPGIRFVVFLQGCPLRCIYCHNRDTWDPALGKAYTVEQVIAELKKYMNYIKFSKGGITLSGGEPIFQPDFSAELFKKCRELGIHTALDTSGFTDIEKVERLLDFTDLILLDIKHADAEMHKTITGAAPEKIKSFALYASKKGIPIWIRYVLVPGLTDSAKDLEAAAEFIGRLITVEKIEVLPYHNMGVLKWEEQGEKYQLDGTFPPTEESIETAGQILGSRRFK
jgi:pyruvate formate lyase activating enzyme